MAEDTEDDGSSDAGSDLFTGVKGSSADSANMPPPSPPAAVGDRSCFIWCCVFICSLRVVVLSVLCMCLSNICSLHVFVEYLSFACCLFFLFDQEEELHSG